MSSSNWLTTTSGMNTGVHPSINNVLVMSSAEMSQLRDYLAGVEISFQGLFKNADEWISQVCVFPFDVSSYYTTVSGHLKLGNTQSTTVNAKRITAYHPYLTLGQWQYSGHFNNFLDLNGYTKIMVFLPYLGYVEVMPNDIYNKYLQVRLKIDFTSGDGLYILGVSDSSISHVNRPVVGINNIDAGVRILSCHSVKLGYPIPLGSSHTNETIRNMLLGGLKLGATAATTAIGLSMSNTPHTSQTSNTVTTTQQELNPATGRMRNISRTVTSDEATRSTIRDDSNYILRKGISDAINVGVNTLGNFHIRANSEKPNNPNLLSCGPQSVHVVVYRPKVQDGDGNAALFGKPLGRTVQLSTLTGYTTISDVHIEGQNFSGATQTEIAMIEKHLYDGVIL